MSAELWARVLVRALVELGVRNVVASPGSRSTPLVLAAAREPGLTLDVIVDERSAGFFALGQARVSGRPSVVLATSGSAGAHYFPAVLEAERSLLPLVVLTADRPWELMGLGANQTLDQRQLFGAHVRRAFELGEPDLERLDYVTRIAALAVLHASWPLPGPVHLNARFRKPLEPSGAELTEMPSVPRLEPRESALRIPSDVARLIAGARRGLVVAGPRLGAATADERLKHAVGRFVRERGFALVAEATSALGFVREALPAVEAWLPAALAAGDAPELILELGSPPTSRVFEQLGGIPRVVVSELGLADPTASATSVVAASPLGFFEALEPKGESDRAWLDRLERRASAAEATLAKRLDAFGEPAAVRSMVDAIPDGAVLFVGNSLPVRDLDTFRSRSERALTVLHQRGLSGIDGLIAGAAGARSVLSPERPMFALLGDVSALHDVGSLALLARLEAPLTLVVLDNGGGRIFGELPIAHAIGEAELERLFSTPPPDFLPHASRAFGVAHERIEGRRALEQALAKTPTCARVLQVGVPAETGRAQRAAVSA